MKYLENWTRYLQTVNGVRLVFVGSFISDQLSFWVNFPFKMFLNYAKCDLIKFTWGFCPSEDFLGGGGDFVLKPKYLSEPI